MTAAWLRSIRVFEGLSNPVLTEFAASMRTQVLEAGAWIHPRQDQSRRLGVVIQGAIEVCRSRDDDAPAASVIGAGGSFGAWTLLGGGRRSGDLRAAPTSETTITELDGEAFDSIVDRHQGLRDLFFRNAVAELRDEELGRAVRSAWGIADPVTVSTLAQACTIRSVVAGEVLVRNGDPARSAFLVLAGGFLAEERSREHADDEPSPAATTTPAVGPGHLVGERALLDSGVRTATLTALRASRVAEFEASAFHAVCLAHPQVLLQTVTEFMRRHDSTVRPEAPQGHRIALVGDGRVDVALIAQRLAAAFPRPITIVDADEVARVVGLSDELSDAAAELNLGRLDGWLDRLSTESSWLLLVADPKQQRWSSACLSHGDQIVAVVDKSTTIPNRHPAFQNGARPLQPTTLLLVHPQPTAMPHDTARILQHLSADAHLHVRIDRNQDFGRAARTLAGVPYGLVLSGGGARGFAHLGAVRGMRELGIPCDVVGGTSIGAVMAAYQGFDMSVEEQITQCEIGFKGLMDYTLPVVSLLKGQRTSERIQRHVGNHTIEDMWVPFFCISTNLSTNDMKIHTSGSIATALRASLALPGLFPPVHDGDHFLVDGGVLNNFPLDVMRARNPFGKVIAIDVAANMLLEARGNFGLQLSGWRAAVAMLQRRPLSPSIATTLMRTTVIGSARDHDKYLRLRYADLHMELALKGCGLLDFGEVRSVAQYGYQAALPQLAAWWQSEANSLVRASL